MKSRAWGVLVSFCCVLAASSCDEAKGDKGPGPIDGTWKIDSCLCDGQPKDYVSGTLVTFDGGSGAFDSSFNDGEGGSCAMTVPFSAVYPSDGAVEWTLTTTTCQPASCNEYQGCNMAVNTKHTATYTISGSTMTLTEPMTPANEFGCPSKPQVCTLTKQ